jgi:hypothetical protein
LIEIPHLRERGIILYKKRLFEYDKVSKEIRDNLEKIVNRDNDSLFYGDLDYIYSYDFQLNITLGAKRKKIKVLDEEINSDVKPIYDLLTTLKKEIKKSKKVINNNSFFSKIYFSDMKGIKIDQEKEFLNDVWINLYCNNWQKIKRYKLEKNIKTNVRLHVVEPYSKKHKFYVDRNSLFVTNENDELDYLYLFDDKFKKRWNFIFDKFE